MIQQMVLDGLYVRKNLQVFKVHCVQSKGFFSLSGFMLKEKLN